MSEKHPERSEKHSEGQPMTAIDHAALMMQQIAEPRPVGDKVKAAITRAAKAVNHFLSDEDRLSYGRAEDIWRREARRIDAGEMDAIRAAHERRNRTFREELREASALADRLERLAAVAIPIPDHPATAEIRGEARQAQRTARALRDLVAAEQRGL